VAFLYNRLIVGPNGESLYLGEDGGDLLLSPTNVSPGALTLAQMQAKVWHLLRVNGPANGFPPPVDQSDFPPDTVTNDLNCALAQFISDSGLAPALSDRMLTTKVVAALDIPIPPGAISVTRLEYTPAGSPLYVLQGKSFQEFDTITGGSIYQYTGQPYYYRAPYFGTVRMQPQPGPGQASNSGVGNIFINGVQDPGSVYTVTIVANGVTRTISYVVQPGDSNQTVAFNLAGLINGSPPSNLLTAQVSLTLGSQIQLFVPNLTPVSYSIVLTGSTTNANAQPSTLTPVEMVGDLFTWYYTSNGTLLVNPGDTPGIPDNFHIALPYRVLGDYWMRKNEPSTAELYMKRYVSKVERAKAFTYDSDRMTQPTLASYDDDEIDGPGVMW